MIDFERFWMDGGRDYDEFEEECVDEDAIEAEMPPGVSDKQIAAWEKRHGVKLPDLLRKSLAIRNGGSVRNTSLDILPLEQMAPVDEDFWEWTEIDEDEAPNHDLMFVFGEESETGATLLMNFNSRGPKGDPSVYFDHHGESTYLANPTLSGFFKAMLASSDAPSVDWSETERLPVVARETIDLLPVFGKSASSEQVLAREGKALVLFTRERSPEGETLTRTTLPLPLDSSCADVSPRRPAPVGTYGLHLQPEESDDIVEQQSETNDDGRWKNSTNRGVPIYVMFESTDRGKLEALRKELFGAEGAARAQAKQDQQAKLEQTLNALAPEHRTATMLQAALAMKEQMDREFAAETGDMSGMPPEFAKMAEIMQKKMQQMVQQAQQKIAASPPDPETVRQIKGLMRGLDDQ